MKAVLICPAERPGMSFLAEAKPLALFPALGKTVIQHWLEHLASLGARQVQILAADRPEQIRAFVGSGSRWGLQVDVAPEMRELTVEEARLKHCRGQTEGWLGHPFDVVTMDYLPTLPKFPLFDSYSGWYRVLLSLLERGIFPNYIGLRQLRPGVWVGRHARIAAGATIHAPCWIGNNVWIGANTQVGPHTVIEDEAFVDSGATVVSSVVGPSTYIGHGSELRSCFALGSRLVNWQSNAATVVPDTFLISALKAPRPVKYTVGLLARAAALLALAVTLAPATFVVLRSWLQGQPAFRLRKAVRPTPGAEPPIAKPVLYYELLHTGRWFRRWPQLWNVFQGDFAWVGNRPLTSIQAGTLSNDFERLWLAAPIGLCSLADATGAIDSFDDEARAHASYFAVCANWRLRFWIVMRVLRTMAVPAPATEEGTFAVPVPEPVVKHQGQV